ncbi:MAG: hypothetical protein L0H28_08340 [Corynebacterium casei]|nr:hypothetical protein [Corynebacterium casei]
MTASKIKSAISAHWFFLAAVCVAAADLFVVTLDNWSNPELLEAGILLDLSVVIPALYLWCYRRSGKASVLRAAALSCLGIWVAGRVVPSEHHDFPSAIGFVRYIGLTLLLVIEIKLVVMIYHAAFGRDSKAAPAAFAAAKDVGMPEWAVRIMAWEASLWRKAWDALRRVMGRN